MTITDVIALAGSGGIVGLAIGFATLRARIRQANADAESAKAQAQKARAEAETIKITNTESATRILVDNLLKPIIKELDETRNEVKKLREALERANNCRYHADCPVLHGMHQLAVAVKGDGRGSGIDRAGGIDRHHAQAGDVGADTGGGGIPPPRGREPP